MENNELPEGWVWTRLGEIGTINPKTTGKNIEDDTEVTFLPMRCVEELTGCFDLSLTKRFSEVKKGYTPFVDGDLIFAKITPCMENGKIAIVRGLKNGMGFGSTEFHVIRLPKIIPENFLFYFLVRQELRKDAKRNMTGSAGQLRVSTSYMQQIIFPLPPLPEQRAIVSKIEQLFSDLDNGIENFKKAQALLKLYRQSVLKAACEGKLVPTEAELARAQGRDYEAADVLLARIKEDRKRNIKGKYIEMPTLDISNLPKLPEGWLWAQAQDVCNWITNGYTPKANDMFKKNGDIPFIKVYNLTKNGDLDFSINPTFISKETHTKALYRSRVFPGDILMNIVGPPLGKVSIVPNIFPEWNINQAIVIYRPLEDYDRKFLCYSLLTENILSWAIKQSKATAGQFNITITICRNLPLPLPPLAEQRRIVAEVERRLSVCDKMEATITESLQKAESLRQSILKKAFEGKLLNKKELEKARNAPDWEPAQMLLERIRQEKERTGEKRKR